MRSKPQLIYTLAILEKYQDTKFSNATYQTKPKGKVYHSMKNMLEESMLLGATRFGVNFIF